MKSNLFVHLDQGFAQGHVAMILVGFHKIYTYRNHIVAHTIFIFFQEAIQNTSTSSWGSNKLMKPMILYNVNEMIMGKNMVYTPKQGYV